MKKLILLVACAALTLSVSAQKKIQYGVKAGLNLSSLSNSDGSYTEEGVTFSVDGKMKTSFYVGFFAEFILSDFIGIQPELVYSRQGNVTEVTASAGGQGISGKSWNRLNYLNVPIMVKLYVLDNLSLDLGPQIGFNLGSNVKVDGVDGTASLDGVQTVDFSVGMGLSYKIAQKFDISARYNLGLTDIAANNDGGEKSKNGVIQVGVGYRF